jgi:hypothetical protein
MPQIESNCYETTEEFLAALWLLFESHSHVKIYREGSLVAIAQSFAEVRI